MFLAATEFSPLLTSLYLATVLALGICAQWTAWRMHVPAIVLLLVFGFAFGQAAPPAEYIGAEVLFAVVSLSVAVILFEGGLSLRFREIRETGRVVIGLVTAGLMVTALLTFFAAKWILGFSTPMAALCGALLTVSGPTVVIPLLRHIRPHRRIGAIVKWEGIVNDPIGAVLAALVFKVIADASFPATGSLVATRSLVEVVRTIAIGSLLGVAAAWLVIALFRRYLVPDYLQNAVVLAIVLLAYTLSNLWQHESGLVTVTILGVVLANQRRVSIKHVVEFKENLRVLLISALFIVLAARVRIDRQMLEDIGWSWFELAWRGAAFLAVLVFIVRPAAVAVATQVGKSTFQEKRFLAWIHPRGIVAAAVASLFALQLKDRAEEGAIPASMATEAEQLVLITFLVIVGTVTIYGLTLGPLARRLDMASRDPQGVLFAGASKPVREIALALKNEGFETLLVDTNAANIAAARMAGLPTCLANIGSEYAHEEIDLGDLGRLLAMTPNDQVNALAGMEFTEHFGRSGVFQLAPPEATHQRKESLHAHRRARILFGDDVTFDRLASRIGRNGKVKRTPLSGDFTYDDFLTRYGASALPLFIVTESGKLKVLATDQSAVPQPGQKVIALVDEDHEPEA